MRTPSPDIITFRVPREWYKENDCPDDRWTAKRLLKLIVTLIVAGLLLYCTIRRFWGDKYPNFTEYARLTIVMTVIALYFLLATTSATPKVRVSSKGIRVSLLFYPTFRFPFTRISSISLQELPMPILTFSYRPSPFEQEYFSEFEWLSEEESLLDQESSPEQESPSLPNHIKTRTYAIPPSVDLAALRHLLQQHCPIPLTTQDQPEPAPEPTP